VEPKTQPLPVRVSALDVWAFLVPAVSFAQVTVVGQLYISELLMLVMLPWLWSARGRLPVPRWFVVLWAGWLLSQIVTDIVVGSVFEDFSRGWAAIVFTLTDLAAILVLAATPRRARLFALGLATSGILGYFIAPSIFAADYPWKFAFGLPVAFVLAAFLSGSIGNRLPLLSAGGFVSFGGLNLLLGFRNLGGISLLTAGYLLLIAFAGRRQAVLSVSIWRTTAGLLLLAVGVLGTLQLYDVAASQGLLGSAAQAEYQSQSGALGVLIGGREEILASTQAVIDSPILGHGSWAKDLKYVDLLMQRLSDLGYVAATNYYDSGLIPTHSYLMGSWVWAGFLGAVFWLGVLAVVVWLLANLYVFRLELAPLVVFFAMLLLWNTAFSPYGADARVLACYSLALCLLGLRQMRRVDVDQTPPRPARWAHQSSSRASRDWDHSRPAGSGGRSAPGWQSREA
jgi:hypothetical protein